MAKKKKTTRKRTSGKAPARKSSAASKKKTSKKKTTKKKTSRTKVNAKKKVLTKRVTKKKTAKKPPAKKKTTSKKTVRKVVKKVAKTPPAKKAPAKKAPAKKAPAMKTVKKAASTKKTTRKKTGARSRSATVGTRSVAAAAAAGSADAQGYVLVNGRRVRMISTKGVVPIRKKTSRVATKAIEPRPEDLKPIKTKLTAKELTHYRNLLLIKRAELVGDLSAMEAEALLSRGDNLSNVPIHMADLGTDTFDQDFMLGLAESERQRIREIDAALLRIQEKIYGVCQMTGKVIPKARLNAKPWAKYTIEAARLRERGQTA